ncbi:MAG: alpha-ketoglutarate-dependent dioxygenase AlkB [Pseudomonadota bacterium]
MQDLFQHIRPEVEQVMPGITVLAGFADSKQLLAALDAIRSISPFRNMLTPGGKPISVAVTNCGDVGWVSDERGYRYQAIDPETRKPWPAMPASWRDTANRAASVAGFSDFVPNACLINRYLPGNRMTAHQDKNERDFSRPVVTVSTGLPAEFLVWGAERAGSPIGVPVYDGDVLVMGGPARMHFHGVKTVQPDPGGHCPHRISLTFRMA